MRLLTAFAAFLAMITISLPAQEFSVEEDLMFARGLAERRMHDLAKGVLDRILEDPSTDLSDQARATLALANLYKDKFRRGLTLESRLLASEKADAAFQRFVREYSDHPDIIRAKMDYAEFLMGLGRYRLRLRDETLLVGGSSEEAEAHRKKALEKLTKAADLFDELRVVIPATGRDEYATTLALAEYYRAIMYYFLGKAQPDDALRMATFYDGINHLEDYIFDNESNLRGYWGYLYKALCHREFQEKSQRKDALASFEGIIYAFESTIEKKAVGWDSWSEALADPGARDLLESTYWRFAETLNRFGREAQAIKRVSRLEEIFKKAGLRMSDPGYLARLEKARAYLDTGDVSASISTVSDVSEAAGASNKFIQFHCDRFLVRVMDEVEAVTDLDPVVVFKAAKGAYSQDRFHDALRYFQIVLGIDRGLGERALECWDFTSRCYRQLGFRREAALAAAEGAFRLHSLDEAKALELARRARGALAKIYKRTGSKADRERLVAHKEQMDQFFGAVSGARYDPGVNKMQEGDFRGAIEEFSAVKPDAAQYELSRAYITFCLVSQAEKQHEEALANRRSSPREKKAAKQRLAEGYRKAIRAADRFLGDVGKRRILADPGRQANRRQALGITALSKAVALKGLERWDDALEALDFFEKGKVENTDLLSKAAILETQIYLGKGALEPAERLLADLERSYPDARDKAANLKGIIGLDWADRSEQLEKKGKRTEALRALARSVAYRKAWIESTHPEISNLLALAQDLYRLNRFDEAKLLLAGILDQWGDVKKPSRHRAKMIELSKLYLARCLVRLGKYIEAAPLLREHYERRKRDKNRLEEYAALLTGTVIESDGGSLVYIPGLGAHVESALKGYKLWGRVARAHADGTTYGDLQEYLKARFHQNLVRWAQGKEKLALKSLRLLRVGIGQNFDRKKGSRKEGFWERRFEWLEKQLLRGRSAPQTPPPAPQPTHFELDRPPSSNE